MDETPRELERLELEAFMPLLGEIECGRHYSHAKADHRSWLRLRIETQLASGVRFYGYTDAKSGVVGIVGIRIDEKPDRHPQAEIVDLGVAEARRRQGIGSALLKHASALAGDRGAGRLYVRTYAGDTRAITFYGRNGFHPVAVIPDANGPDDEGDVVLRKRLDPADSTPGPAKLFTKGTKRTGESRVIRSQDGARHTR
jgi:GNAT superfamily N-acetyltransferase